MGYLPWQSEKENRQYKNIVNKEGIETSVKLINIIHEDVGRSPEFELAHKLVEEAERIYFLGFGYDKTNVKRLCLHPLGKTYAGTAYRLSPPEISLITNSLFSNFMIKLYANEVLYFLRYNVALE